MNWGLLEGCHMVRFGLCENFSFLHIENSCKPKPIFYFVSCFVRNLFTHPNFKYPVL